MVEQITVAQLFDMAIAAEHTAEHVYRSLKEKFRNHPDVAQFWDDYADEEVGHANWLNNIRKGLAPEQLDAPVEAQIIEKMNVVLRFSAENALREVEDLEDAYQLASDLENSETNAIFEFLVDHFASDERTQAFLRAMLREHVAKLLIDFPSQFRTATVRRGIKAL